MKSQCWSEQKTIIMAVGGIAEKFCAHAKFWVYRYTLSK